MLKLVTKKISNIKELREAVKNKKIILTKYQSLGLKYYNDLGKKIPRVEISSFDKFISKSIKKVNKKDILLTYSIAGSYRRKIKESKDIDLIIGYKNKKDIESLLIHLKPYIIGKLGKVSLSYTA